MTRQDQENNRNIKASLRAERLGLRDRIDPLQRLEKSLAIAAYGEKSLIFTAGTVVSGFFPIRSEPDVRPLLSHLKARGARLCLPVVLDRETIAFRELLPDAELVDTGFGTRGPGPNAPLLDPDLLLLPLSAFDAAGNRIGYGAGHYDRAIARARQKGRMLQLIGIAFDCQEVPEVPFEPHDFALDAVITESGYRKLGTGMGAEGAGVV